MINDDELIKFGNELDRLDKEVNYWRDVANSYEQTIIHLVQAIARKEAHND